MNAMGVYDVRHCTSRRWSLRFTAATGAVTPLAYRERIDVFPGRTKRGGRSVVGAIKREGVRYPCRHARHVVQRNSSRDFSVVVKGLLMSSCAGYQPRKKMGCRKGPRGTYGSGDIHASQFPRPQNR